jgi:hypothetical protein
VSNPTNGEIGTCGAGLCDRPAVAYVSRTTVTRTSGGRLLTIVGSRADWLAHTGPAEIAGVTQLRCLDCVHGELDELIREAAAIPAAREDGNPWADPYVDGTTPTPLSEKGCQ